MIKKIENKFSYDSNTIIDYTVSDEFTITIKKKDTIKPDTTIAKRQANVNDFTVKYDGKLLVKVDDKIDEGTLLAKSIIKKTVSKYKGRVTNIDEDKKTIYIEQREHLIDNVNNDVKSEYKLDFDVTSNVLDVCDNNVSISLGAVTLNLFQAKGDLVRGKLYILSNKDLENPMKLSDKVNEKIVLVDYLTDEVYSLLSTFNVRGIIANSLDYYFYKDLILLSASVGVICKYGEVGLDREMKMILKKYNDKTIVFDPFNKRLIIPEDKNVKWVNYVYSVEL